MDRKFWGLLLFVLVLCVVSNGTEGFTDDVSGDKGDGPAMPPSEVVKPPTQPSAQRPDMPSGQRPGMPSAHHNGNGKKAPLPGWEDDLIYSSPMAQNFGKLIGLKDVSVLNDDWSKKDFEGSMKKVKEPQPTQMGSFDKHYEVMHKMDDMHKE